MRLDGDLLAMAHHIKAVDAADGRVRLTLRRSEGGEVMLAEIGLRRLVHGLVVQPVGYMPDASRLQRRRRPAVEDPEAVMPALRRNARIEVRRGKLRESTVTGSPASDVCRVTQRVA